MYTIVTRAGATLRNAPEVLMLRLKAQDEHAAKSRVPIAPAIQYILDETGKVIFGSKPEPVKAAKSRVAKAGDE